MKYKILCVLLGVTLSWTFAAVAATAQVRDKEAKEAKDDVLYPPYLEKRYIGLLKEGTADCPGVPGWTAEKLLNEAFPQRRQQSPDPYSYSQPVAASRPTSTAGRAPMDPKLHELGLDKLCVYTASPTAGAFSKPPGLMKAEPDRMGMVSSAHYPALGDVGNQIWAPLADHFLDQVGKVRLAGTATPSVRLVFIDTEPTGDALPTTYPARSWHGYSLAHMAQRLICGDYDEKSCAVQIATRLALRYDNYDKAMSFSPDPGSDAGGYLGRVSDLATAIVAEVDHWQEVAPRQKLILNLSVGWDGELHTEGKKADLDAWKAKQLDPASLAVYKALRYARSRGALVIAASGNHRGGPKDSKWPLLPAAWELKRPTWLPFGLGPKRVYAVGGLDWQGLPLANTRAGAMPRRAAYGDHAVARTGEIDADTSTTILTGTSVSAAVTSSIAAALWHLQPNLRAAQVLKRITRSGEALDSRADFYPWKPLVAPPRVRRVSLCRTLQAACGANGQSCPALQDLNCQYWEHPGHLDLSWIQHPPTKPCKSCVQVASSPGSQLPSVESLPWIVGPQPPGNPCQNCTIIPDPPGSAATTSNQDYALQVDRATDWQDGNPNATIGYVELKFTCTGSPDPWYVPITDEFKAFLQTSDSSFSLSTLTGKSLIGCTGSIIFDTTVTGFDHVGCDTPILIDP